MIRTAALTSPIHFFCLPPYPSFVDPVPDLAEIQALQKDAGNTPLKFAVVRLFCGADLAPAI